MTRSIFLDALRAVALVRVVVYHASGSWTLTAFTAMPLMFFIAGTLYAASLERRPARRVVLDRYRRILEPYWVYLAAMIGLWAWLGVLGEITPFNWVAFLFPVVSLNGPKGPGADTILHLTWFALWYIQMHLILALVGGPLRNAQRNRPKAMWATIVALFVVSCVGAPALGIALFYAACWIVGYYHFDGSLDRWLRTRWVAICAVCLPVGAAAFFVFHTRAPVVAAFGVAFLGIFWLCLALGLQPRIEPLLAGRRTRSVVNWFSQRSLTIYLWHGVALWAILEWSLPGSRALPIELAWCALLLVGAVLVFGWAEDVAAKRRITLWPRLPSARHRAEPVQEIDLRATPAAALEAGPPATDAPTSDGPLDAPPTSDGHPTAPSASATESGLGFS